MLELMVMLEYLSFKSNKFSIYHLINMVSIVVTFLLKYSVVILKKAPTRGPSRLLLELLEKMLLPSQPLVWMRTLFERWIRMERQRNYVLISSRDLIHIQSRQCMAK
jgi:hypothetical protein